VGTSSDIRLSFVSVDLRQWTAMQLEPHGLRQPSQLILVSVFNIAVKPGTGVAGKGVPVSCAVVAGTVARRLSVSGSPPSVSSVDRSVTRASVY
jgi:hypothetical protein